MLLLLLPALMPTLFYAVVSEPCRSEADGSTLCQVRYLSEVWRNSTLVDGVSRMTVRCTVEDEEEEDEVLGPSEQLKDLVLEDCWPRTFAGAPRLTNLTVRGRLRRLSADAFSPLQSLERLDLSNNGIDRLPQTLLCPLRRLVTLNLTENAFEEVTAVGLSDTDGGVLCLADVQRVQLSRNRIRVLPDGGFAAGGQLRELRLDRNVISRAEEKALRGLARLNVLDLSGNRVVALPPRVLSPCAEALIELYLQKNSISVLPPGLLDGLGRLRILDLSRNELASHWLTADTFADLAALETLDLSDNRLTRVDAAPFRGTPRLQTLRLSRNRIEELEDGAFTAMTQLETLLLDGNRLVRLGPDSMKGLRGLRSLYLNGNQLRSLHRDAFQECGSALLELYLSKNRLASAPEALRALVALRSLDLSENEIGEAGGAYRGLEQLYSLSLSGNRIGNLSRGAFEDLPSLRILGLSNNRIEAVEAGTFDDVPELHALRLDANFLTDVNGLFGNLHDLLMLNVSANRIAWFDYALVPVGLQWLDLHSNRVEALGDYFELGPLLKLRTLDASDNDIVELDAASLPDGIEIAFLRNNQIETVRPFAFAGKPNLTRVDLSKNRLRGLEASAFRPSADGAARRPEFWVSGNPFVCDCHLEWALHQPRFADLVEAECAPAFARLSGANATVPVTRAASFLCRYGSHCFALCHCCEFDACDCEMTCPEGCACYYDQSWATNIVDCGSRGLEAVPRRVPMDATALYLDGNTLPVLASHTFIGRKNMRALYLNDSQVRVIENRTFNGLRSLERLHLQRNRLAALYGHEFSGLASLQELYLSHNRLTTVAEGAFAPLVSLRVLHIDYNRIAEMPAWRLEVATIRLAHNPWSCECRFAGRLARWLRGPARDRVLDAHELRCGNDSLTLADPPCAAAPVQVRPEARSGGILVPAAALAAVLILAAVVGGLLLAFRSRLAAWFSARRVFNAEDDKLFDAFVCYAKKDELFVGQVLAPRLERQYRLCLRHRDLPGCPPADAVLEAARSCRRTILVLTENGAPTPPRTGKRRPIVIVVGRPPHLLDPEIRPWLEAATLLRWGDERFWDKLRRALPRARPSPPDPDPSVAVHM